MTAVERNACKSTSGSALAAFNRREKKEVKL